MILNADYLMLNATKYLEAFELGFAVYILTYMDGCCSMKKNVIVRVKILCPKACEICQT